MNIRDAHDVVHREHLAWHTRCGLDLQYQQPAELFERCKLVSLDVAPTCLWCTTGRRRH